MVKARQILPPTYFIIAIFLTIPIHFLIPLKQIIYFPYNLTGLLLLILSGVLNILADNTLKKFNTTVKPFDTSAALVAIGVYRISRNPMYLGMFLFLLGESIILGSIVSFLVPLVFIMIMKYRFILTEEKMLTEEFKENYSNYCKKVRRWI